MVFCHSCHTMEWHPSSLLTPWNGILSFLSHHGTASQQSSYSMEWYPVILVTPWNGIPAVFLLHGMVSWQFQQGGVWWTRILWTFSKQLEQVSNLLFYAQWGWNTFCQHTLNSKNNTYGSFSWKLDQRGCRFPDETKINLKCETFKLPLYFWCNVFGEIREMPQWVNAPLFVALWAFFGKNRDSSWPPFMTWLWEG